MREALRINEVYILTAASQIKELYIRNVIGMGGSCIVYDAFYLDDDGLEHMVRVKECFPEGSCEDTRAEDNSLIWKSGSLQEKSLERFRGMYRKQMRLQNKNGLINKTSKINDVLYEANNTLYLLMECDYGESYRFENGKNLYDNLRSIKALASSVKEYHKIGILHLDLKPENFLILPDTPELIKLFDFDSLVSIAELAMKKVKSISCSKAWAAPELQQLKLNKIKETADVYGIGAIVYYTLFGEAPGIEAVLSLGEFDYTQVLSLNGINPAIKRKFDAFFTKTLASNPKNRFQNMSEVIHALDELIRFADPKYEYLLSSVPVQSCYFAGRAQELERVSKSLEKNQLLIINGIGGIGKSELALHYVLKNQKQYDVVIWAKCASSSLQEVLCNQSIFKIANNRTGISDENEWIQYVLQLLNENTLIILDDFSTFDDEVFKCICRSGAKIIVTTRTDASMLFERETCLPIDCMDTNTLKDVFWHYYKRSCEPEEDSAVEKLIRRFDHYTLLIPLLAKQMIASSLLPSEMYEKVRTFGVRESFDEKIIHVKDEEQNRDSMYNHLRNLFSVAALSDELCYPLRALSLLSTIAIDKKYFAELISENGSCDAINQLIELGWFLYDEKQDNIYFHDVIREVLLQELKPNYENTHYFMKKCLDVVEKIEYAELDGEKLTKRAVQERTNMLGQILNNLCFSHPSNEDYYITAVETLGSVREEAYIGFAWRMMIDDYAKNLGVDAQLLFFIWQFKFYMNNLSSEAIERAKSVIDTGIKIANSRSDWSGKRYTNRYDFLEDFLEPIWNMKYSYDFVLVESYADTFFHLDEEGELRQALLQVMDEIERNPDGAASKRHLEYAGEQRTVLLDAYKSYQDKLDKEKKTDKQSGLIDKICNQLIYQNKTLLRNRQHNLIIRVYSLGIDINMAIFRQVIIPKLYCNSNTEEVWATLKKRLCTDVNSLSDIGELCEQVYGMHQLFCDLGNYVDPEQLICLYMRLHLENEDSLAETFSMIAREENMELEQGYDLSLFKAFTEKGELNVPEEYRNEFIEQFYSTIYAKEHDREYRVCLLYKEICERCFQADILQGNNSFWEELTLVSVTQADLRNFVRYVKEFSSKLDLKMYQEEIPLEKRDVYLVERLVDLGLCPFALKICMDILERLEQGIHNATVPQEVMEYYLNMASSLCLKTGEEELYYQIQNKSKKLIGVHFSAAEKPEFEVRTGFSLKQFNEYIDAAVQDMPFEERVRWAEKAHQEFLHDENTRYALCNAFVGNTELRELQAIGRKLPKYYITSKEYIDYISEDYAEQQATGLYEANGRSMYQEMESIGEICLHAAFQNRIEEYKHLYKIYQELPQIFKVDRIDGFLLMQYTLLPEVLVQIESSEVQKAVYDIYDAMDRFIETLYGESIDEALQNEKYAYTQYEKIYMLPYLTTMYDFLVNAEPKAAERKRYQRIRDYLF